MNTKCKPGRFVMGEAVPYGQTYTYSSMDSMEDMLKPEYYAAMNDQLRPGDSIRVMRVDREDVLELAEVLVSSKNDGKVQFYVTRKPEKTKPGRNKPGPKPRVRTLKVEEGKGCVYLVDEKGQIAGEFANKQEANKAKPELERVA